jgi:hypothetical protein
MFAAFSLFVGLLSVAYGEPSACVVSKNEFTWDFKPWKGKSVGFTTDRFNYPPMMGNWTYQIDFCNHLILRSQDVCTESFHFLTPFLVGFRLGLR